MAESVRLANEACAKNRLLPQTPLKEREVHQWISNQATEFLGNPLRNRSNTESYYHYSWKTAARSTCSVAPVLGEELRKLRIAAGLTQEQLAFKAGLARNYISLLELDRKSPTLKTLF